MKFEKRVLVVSVVVSDFIEQEARALRDGTPRSTLEMKLRSDRTGAKVP